MNGQSHCSEKKYREDDILYSVELEFSDHLIIDDVSDLPENWNTFPFTAETVTIGTAFIQHKKLCFKVPSAIIPSEFNFLLNPMHDDLNEVKFLDARPLILDKRLFQN